MYPHLHHGFAYFSFNLSSFEYNWFFRRHGWRPNVGWCGAGGYVRRRRWVRLMMRPSDARLQAEAAVEDRCEDETNMSESRTEHLEDTVVWKGDEDDWNRVRKALKSLARDGLKLDLWTDWLSDLIGDGIFTPPRLGGDDPKQYIPDTQPGVVADSTSRSQERPHREWILAVLREHVSFHVFISSLLNLTSLIFHREKSYVVASSTPIPEHTSVISL